MTLPSPAPLAVLESLDGYRAHFMDTQLFLPYVQAVCQSHALTPADDVRVGLAGTCPTFIVNQRWVVKFFGRLFEGLRAFQVESAAAHLLSAVPGLPVPGVAASGRLFDTPGAHPWPYLVYEFLPGLSLGQAPLTFDEKERAAGWLGGIVRRLHALPLDDCDVFPADGQSYLHLLQTQRAACSHALSGILPWPDELEAFLIPPAALFIPGEVPHLIHADLTRDHLFVQQGQAGWQPTGLIDFGDAMTGSLYYELVALHIDLFDCDPRLLRTFLQHYAPAFQPPADFARRAMSATLLHCFNAGLFAALIEHYPQARSLSELAQLAWGL